MSESNPLKAMIGRIDLLDRRVESLEVEEHAVSTARTTTTGGGTYVIEVLDFAINNVLLLKDGEPYPGVYPPTDAGLAAANAAATADDVVLVPVATFTGDYTVGTSVEWRGRGVGFSVLTGQITLSDGSLLDGLSIVRTADQAGDLVCLVPPESGMAYCEYCWIVANNADGAGYCVQGDCDNLTLRSCYVRAYSGLVDSNPFDGGEAGAWPSTVYAATQTLGIYYTEDSLDPGEAQPEWATLNTGLTNTDIRSFCLDRHEEPADTRMFCIDDTTNTLYRRTDGDWAAVLTSADARTVAGVTDNELLMSVAVDPVTGYVYAGLWRLNSTCRIYCLRSVDHGDNWTAASMRARGWLYGCSNIDAYNGLVVMHELHWPIGMRVLFSTNHGLAWTYFGEADSISIYTQAVRIHHGAGNTWYGNIAAGAIYDLLRCTTASASDVMLRTEFHGPYATAGGFWMDPYDPLHLLVATRQGATQIMETYDAGATQDSDVATSVEYMHEIGDGCKDGYWVQGCSWPVSATPTPPARAPVYVSTDAVTLTNRSGTNFDTAPYTNAIPVTCGGITPWGLWVVYPSAAGSTTPNVHACIIPNAQGRAEGIPEWGDRSAWETAMYGVRHASDWTAGATHHQAVTLGEGSSPALALDGQTLTLAYTLDLIVATAGAALSAGDFVQIYNDGGTLKARPADASLNRPAVGYVTADYDEDDTAQLSLGGLNEYLAGLTIGATLYLSTEGGATETAPTTSGYIVQPLGIVTSAESAAFRVQHTILLA